MEEVKIVTISAVPYENHVRLFGVDEKGRVWVNYSPDPKAKGMWQMLESPTEIVGNVEYANNV